MTVVLFIQPNVSVAFSSARLLYVKIIIEKRRKIYDVIPTPLLISYYIPPLLQPQLVISFSGRIIIVPVPKVLLLKYRAIQKINVVLTGDYKTDRELIFSKGGFIKDTPIIKAIMMITGYVQARGYVKVGEIFEDKIVSIYSEEQPRTYGRLFFYELVNALLARITNYFQVLQGVREESLEEIKQEIELILNILTQQLKIPKYDVVFKVDLYDTPPSYEVLVEIYERK